MKAVEVGMRFFKHQPVSKISMREHEFDLEVMLIPTPSVIRLQCNFLGTLGTIAQLH